MQSSKMANFEELSFLGAALLLAGRLLLQTGNLASAICSFEMEGGDI